MCVGTLDFRGFIRKLILYGMRRYSNGMKQESMQISYINHVQTNAVVVNDVE